jgi:hypothetical protein
MTVQGLEQVAFQGGEIVTTQGIKALREKGLNVHELLQRHFLGDDGDVSERDRVRNLAARANGARVFSSYITKPHGKVWIITECDRSYTTVMLPDEY